MNMHEYSQTVGRRHYPLIVEEDGSWMQLLLATVPYCCGSMAAYHLTSSDDLKPDLNYDYRYGSAAGLLPMRKVLYEQLYDRLMGGEFKCYMENYSEEAHLSSQAESTYHTERSTVVLWDAIGGEQGAHRPSIYEMLHGRDDVSVSAPAWNPNSDHYIVTYTLTTKEGDFTEEHPPIEEPVRIDWTADEILDEEDW